MNKRKKGFLFYVFTFVFFITPNLPMPTSSLGPVGPALYLGLLFLLLVLRSEINSTYYKNKYFYVIFGLSFLLALSDILKLILFGYEYEINFLFVRILNVGILFTYIQFLIVGDRDTLGIDPFYFKVYFYSILSICLILYAQAFGIITYGEVFTARTYFGFKLPFNKPVGLVQLSDGKLGIMIAPIIFMAILSTKEKLRFFKVPWPYLVAVVLFILLIIMQSRSAYLAFAISSVVFIMLYPSKRIRMLFYFGGFLITLLTFLSGFYKILWIGLVGEGIYERNVDARGNVLQHAFETFMSSPIYGVGHKNLLLYENPFSTHGLGVHNLFADHLGSGGLIAIVPFILIFVVYFYYNIKVYKLASFLGKYKVQSFTIWLISSMVYVIVEIFFYRGFYNEYLYLFLALGTLSYLNLTNIKTQNTG